MTVSYLTTSEDVLVAGVISMLVDEGYTFLPLSESEDKFFARVLTGLAGSTFSHLTTGPEAVLAAILNDLTGGSFSHLTSSRAQLLAGIFNALESGSPPTGDASLDFSQASNSQYVALLEDI